MTTVSYMRPENIATNVHHAAQITWAFRPGWAPFVHHVRSEIWAPNLNNIHQFLGVTANAEFGRKPEDFSATEAFTLGGWLDRHSYATFAQGATGGAYIPGQQHVIGEVWPVRIWGFSRVTGDNQPAAIWITYTPVKVPLLELARNAIFGTRGGIPTPRGG